MWKCECGLKFKDPLIGIGNIELCPLCESENIWQIENIIPDLDKEIDFALDSFEITKQDYEEAGLEMPEHPNCSCINEPIYHKPVEMPYSISGTNRIEFTPLSFDDLETNEMCLLDLGLPKGYPTSLEMPVPAISYYSEMNSRFLRTFLGEPVWA